MHTAKDIIKRVFNMKTAYLVLGISLLVLLIGCTAKKGETVEIQPFLGGTTGLEIDFADLRADVFDGGRDPFDVVVKLENKGETLVPKERVSVKLSGINPAEFSKLEEQLTKNPEEDLIETRKDAAGTTTPGVPVFVEFTELNHFSPISASAINFPLRANVCFMYSTKAVSKVCIRRDVLSPQPGGICEVNGDKPVFSSGAPIQISNFKESSRAKDKIGFSFEIVNSGGGDAFERNTDCDKSQRRSKDRIFVKVDTNIPGLGCTGLVSSGRTAEGFVTLFSSSKLVTCTQEVSTRTDYEQLVKIEAVYDYEIFRETQITVKSSGETGEEVQ